MKNSVYLLITLLFLLTINSLKAQNCGTCSISINNSDTSSLVLSSGQTLCIDTMGYFSGSITLNGGTICNKGFFKPVSFTFNSGTLNNLANSSFDGNTTISSGKTITNQPGAILSIIGSLTISGGTYSNDGISNIDTTINNNSGSFSNSSIINCTQLTGSNTFVNTGIINAN